MKKLSLVFVLALLPALNAQKVEDSGATIRTETRVVLVDAVVTDKKGGYVHGLGQKDFRVWEDNKEQTVTSFLFQADSPSDENQTHYMVMFFDNTTLKQPDLVYTRQAATRFIDANAGPKRQIAVLEYRNTLRTAQNFTDDKERLKQVINGMQFAGSALPGTVSPRLLLDAIRRTAIGMAKTPGRKTFILLSAGFSWNDELVPDINATISACNRNNVAIYPIDVRGLVAPHGALLPGAGIGIAAMNATALAFQGRGPAAPSTGGGGVRGGAAPTPSPSPSPGAGRAPGTPTAPSPGTGNRTPVNNGGYTQNPLNTNQQIIQRQKPPLIPDLSSITGPQQVLFALAQGTGGFVIANSNDLLGGMEKIGREQNEYYVVGYTPKQELEPGSCHTLKVKVDRSGVNVRARTGYCDAKPLDILSGTAAERDIEAKVKGGAKGSIDAAVQAPFFYTGPNTARISLAMDVPPATLKFSKEKGHNQAVLNVIATALTPENSVAARFSDSVKVTIDDKKQMQEFEKKPFHYEKQFEVASGKYTLRVAFASGGGDFGRVDVPVEVEPWNDSQFGLSGLVLSKSAVPASELSLSADAALLEDEKPFIVNGVRIIPSATYRFHKSENGFVFAELYEPGFVSPEAGKDLPQIGVSMMLLDATKPTVTKDFGVTRLNPVAGTAAVPVGLKIPLDQIAPGTYRLMVTGIDSADRKFGRASTIVVEP